MSQNGNMHCEHGLDLDQVLGNDDLVKGDNIFFAATGITDGDHLEGVKYFGGGARTASMVMRSNRGPSGSSKPRIAGIS